MITSDIIFVTIQGFFVGILYGIGFCASVCAAYYLLWVGALLWKRKKQ